MLLIFLLPTYLIRFKAGIPTTLLEVMILMVSVVWFWTGRNEITRRLSKVWKKGVDSPGRVGYPFGVEAVLWLVVAMVAVGVANFTNQSFGIWKAYFFEPVLLYLVILNVMGKKDASLSKKLGMIIWPMTLSALAVSLLAVYQKVTGQFIANPLWAAAETRRVVSFFGYPNAVGLYVESIIFLALGYYFIIAKRPGRKENEGKIVKPEKHGHNHGGGSFFAGFFAAAQNDHRVQKVLLLLTIFLSLLAIIFAKSVGASLGVGAGFVMFALLYSKKSRHVTLAVLLIAIVSITVYQPLRHRALKYATLNDFSGQVRKAQWLETEQLLRTGRNWLVGTGLSNYQKAIAPFHRPGIFIKDYDDSEAQRKLVFNEKYRAAHWQPLEIYMYPHNIVLNFWTELGLVGLLLFAWFIGKYYFSLWSLAFRLKNAIEVRPVIIGLAAAMVAFLVHGLVDVPYFKNDLAVIFWLLAALLSLIKLHQPVSRS
ncbi:hypothetical protein HGA64_04085 [Candidatus Falkowbacteria bacterium]|nr:hypothetical protein [Candidatus Falkowbacteria bacterium]